MSLGSRQRECSCSYQIPEIIRKVQVCRPFQNRKHSASSLCAGKYSFSIRRPDRWYNLVSVRAADLSADLPQEPEEEQFTGEVFPRIREGNPYRRLGISEEASFEEVQEARNFLYETYKHHEASREAIELAYDKILKTAFKRREKFGFQPPKTGRKTDKQGDQLAPTLVERIKDSVEPAVGIASIVNDGSIFLVLGLWAAWQASATDPTFPMALTLIYSVYKFFTKKKNRNPDGPHFGGSPIWAALGMSILAFVIGLSVSFVLLRLIKLPGQIPADGAGLFIVCAIVGIITLFFR